MHTSERLSMVPKRDGQSYEASRLLQIGIDGRFSRDLPISTQVEAKLLADRVRLRCADTGETIEISVDRPPGPGVKAYANEPLEQLVGSPFVGAEEPGGGVLGVACGMAEAARELCVPTEVHVLSSSKTTREAQRRCDEQGICIHDLACHVAPITVNIPLDHDRLLIRDRLQPCTDGLTDPQFAEVQKTVRDANLVVSASSKCPALASATFTLGNGARKCMQATGSLPREHTLALLARADTLACNFDELCRLGRRVGLSVPNIVEDAPEAPSTTHGVLTELRRWGLAGLSASLVTLGSKGTLVMDWVRGRFYQLLFGITDDSEGVQTAAGSGDLLTGFWLMYRQTWAASGHLRDPEAAAVDRAMRRVARKLGLRPDQYELWTIRRG